MPRSDRRRRVVYCSCHTRDHYASECPTAADRPQRSGGGPSMSFMATTTSRGRSDTNTSIGKNKVTPNIQPWLIDSGASDNMRSAMAGFTDFSGIASEASVANGQTLLSPGRGSITLPSSLSGHMTLTNTLHVPGISANLFSVRAADRAGGDIRFQNGTVTIKKNGVTVATGSVNDDEQYELSLRHPGAGVTPASQQSANVDYGTANPLGYLWHRRFGHLGYQNVSKAAKIVTGMTLAAVDIKATVGVVCEPCIKARMQAHPQGQGERASDILERICVELIGPITPISAGGAAPALSLTDARSDMSFVTALKTKADAGEALRDWIVCLEN
eukprot:TRINITY_DN3453_c1_g1_i1.p1 TRINITY_DN3453_c1_g1~~TRINITY_DN3453_c1_g1_i1.p1  ORF type:complete len:330 (+),score=52.49 TRINITY_DN3453_c1_g1_i1:92-1081(+)